MVYTDVAFYDRDRESVVVVDKASNLKTVSHSITLAQKRQRLLPYFSHVR